MDISMYDMTAAEVDELAVAFTRGQRAFLSAPNPYNDAFLTWDAFNEGQNALTTTINPYQLTAASVHA
jgi:hypothetical protein